MQNTETSLQFSYPNLQRTTKEFNAVSICHNGQETVQDIVGMTQEVFQTLKDIQLPNGISSIIYQRNKLQELLRTIKLSFGRLRLLYETCNSQLQEMECIYFENLLPFVNDMDQKYDDKTNSEVYKKTFEERREIKEIVLLKNRQLKEIIEYMRRIICEVNTLLTMRRV